MNDFSSKQIFLDLHSVFQLSRVAMTRGRYRFRTKHATDQDTTPKSGRHDCPATYTEHRKFSLYRSYKSYKTYTEVFTP